MNRLLTILIALVVISACTRDSETGPVCHISGTVSPIFEEYLAITYGEYLDSTKIDDDGNFSVEVPASESGFGMLIYNDRLVKIFVEAGKNLQIKISSNNFPDKLEFDGKLGPINHYLQLSRRLDKQTEISSQELFGKEAQEFISITDSIREIKDKLLNEYLAKYPDMDSSFALVRSTDILYAWASQQLLYPGYYSIVKNKIPNLPDNYHQEYLKELDLNNHDLLNSPIFKTFLENYLDYKEAVYLDKHPEVEKLWFPGSVSRFRAIHEEFTDQEIKDYLLFNAMSDHLDSFGIEHIETFITNFRLSCTNDEFKQLIEEKYSVNETLARGKQAPELSFYNKEGNKVKLSDLKGKLLYINFWASWSEWSIQEFPYWEKLRKDFDGYEINFVSVSMDFLADKNKWEYILDKQKLGGIQLIQDPESNSLKDLYFINDLPRYFLIDRDGNIISAFAPRPSENIEPVLKNLLKN